MDKFNLLHTPNFAMDKRCFNTISVTLHLEPFLPGILINPKIFASD